MTTWINMGAENTIKVLEEVATVLDTLNRASADGTYCRLTLIGGQNNQTIGDVFVNPAVVNFVRALD